MRDGYHKREAVGYVIRPIPERGDVPTVAASEQGRRVVESWVVAIDVGGTFTDAVAFGSGGSIRVAKVPSTPEDPSRGLAEAVSELVANGVSPGRVRLLSHGTTVATNAVLTGRMARAVLVATEGFRD